MTHKSGVTKSVKDIATKKILESTDLQSPANLDIPGFFVLECSAYTKHDIAPTAIVEAVTVEGIKYYILQNL